MVRRMSRRHRLFLAPALAALLGAALVSPGGGAPAAASLPPGDDACVVYHTGAVDEAGDPGFVADAAGTDIGRVPPLAGISPDGRMRAYLVQQAGEVQVRVSALDGSGDRLLHDFTGSPYRPSSNVHFIWAGDRIAVLVIDDTAGTDRNTRLGTIDVSTGGFRVIDPAMPVVYNGYDLSADGSKVTYADASGVFRGSHIWVADADGTDRVEIVHDPKPDYALPPYIPPKSVTNLRFSPDGTKIAFSGRDGISNGVKSGPTHELWVVNADGTGFREVAANPVNDRWKVAPVWSPDGTRIAYSWAQTTSSLERTAGYAVYDLSSDTSTDVAGSSGISAGNAPVRPMWSASSNTIFGTVNREVGDDFDNGLYAVPVAGGTPVKLLGLEGTQSEAAVGLIPCDAVPRSTYAGLTPARILDTRTGLGAPQARLGAGASLTMQTLGQGGVPAAGVDAVALNVTATNTTADSYLTVSPTGVERPNASNVNWSAGATVPNAVVVKVGAGGAVDIFNAFGETDVIVDVVGWFAAGPGFTGITPTRLLDTRSGIGAPAGKVGPGSDIGLLVRGGAIPESATGVILNATATEASEQGYVTVYPSGTTRTETSSLNMAAGQTVANLVVSGIGADGQVRLFNALGSTHLIADAAGYFEAGSGYTGIAPTRVLDSRQTGGRIGPGQTDDVRVAGIGTNVPTNARAVIVNVTAVDPTEGGYFTVFPTGVQRPNASNLNFVAGQTVPNLVFAQIGEDQQISIFNERGRTDVIVDIVGWFA
jgi:Tol biopolymer transport system component